MAVEQMKKVTLVTLTVIFVMSCTKNQNVFHVIPLIVLRELINRKPQEIQPHVQLAMDTLSNYYYTLCNYTVVCTNL